MVGKMVLQNGSIRQLAENININLKIIITIFNSCKIVEKVEIR